MGGTIQLAIFAMVAAKVKMNANGAHTFLEVIIPSQSTQMYMLTVAVVHRS